MQLPMTFLQAIAHEEGFYATGTRPCRNNNPGNIEYGKFTQAHGASSGDPRFAVFPDADSGFSAMKALFRCPGYKGLTVAQALNRWAPPVENATNSYIGNVCKWTGLTPDTVIDDFLDQLFVAPAPPVVLATPLADPTPGFIPTVLRDPESASPAPAPPASQSTSQ